MAAFLSLVGATLEVTHYEFYGTAAAPKHQCFHTGTYPRKGKEMLGPGLASGPAQRFRGAPQFGDSTVTPAGSQFLDPQPPRKSSTDSAGLNGVKPGIDVASPKYWLISSTSFLSQPTELTDTVPSCSIRKLVGTCVMP